MLTNEHIKAVINYLVFCNPRRPLFKMPSLQNFPLHSGITSIMWLLVEAQLVGNSTGEDILK